MVCKEDLVLVGSFMGHYVLQRGTVHHEGQIADPSTTVNHADIILSNQVALVSGNDRKTRLLDLASLAVTHTFTFAFPINVSYFFLFLYLLCLTLCPSVCSARPCHLALVCFVQWGIPLKLIS